MDERQESNQNQDQNQNQSMKSNQAQSGGTNGSQATLNVSALLDESPLPRPAIEWIKCLRAPAMSLSISMEKRHIPNYDTEKASGSAESSGNGKSGNGSGSLQASGTTSGQAGGAEGMSFSHRCTVRYFDLALGAVAVMLVGCLCKTCTGCKRAMKRWF